MAIRIQLVLYRNAFDDVRRTVTAVRACVREARTDGRVGAATVAIGDCSPSPAITEAQIDELRTLLADADVGGTYEFFDANLGSAGGSNRLAVRGDEPLVWVLNPDTYPSPACLSELVAAVATPGVAAADARQMPVEHPKWYDPDTGEAGWISGACMLLERSAFDAVGGFDDAHFPLYCDDVDLSWRLRFAGHRVVTVPRAVVFHDKRIDAQGMPMGSEVERESGALAHLLLLTRFEHADLVPQRLAELDASTDPALRRAADEFRRRREAGLLPDTIAGSAAVADFSTPYYGPYRFGY